MTNHLVIRLIFSTHIITNNHIRLVANGSTFSPESDSIVGFSSKSVFYDGMNSLLVIVTGCTIGLVAAG